MKQVLIILLVIVIGCNTQKFERYSDHSEKFSDKFITYVNSNESIVKAWYHYLVTTENSGQYILRTFYPETKQIISEVKYDTHRLSNANGFAKYWHENGNMKSEGNYQNNESEGIWKYYHRKSGEISSKGKFVSNLKEGDWIIYDHKGRIESEVTYVKDVREGKFIEYDTLQNITNKGFYKNDSIIEQTRTDTTKNSFEFGMQEQMPYLEQCNTSENIEDRDKCSSQALIDHIYKKLRYPPNARKYGIEGMTVTQFVIEDDGTINDIDVVIGLCDEFKKECERVLSNMPKWEPGIQKGEKVKVLFTMPIRFKLE